MMKKSKLMTAVASLLFMSALLLAGFWLKSQQVSAAAQDNVITSLSITDERGAVLDHGLNRYERFRINANFSLPNGQVKAGDTTTMHLPTNLAFGDSKAFEIRDTDGNVVANAVIDPSSRQVVLTYTDYVETHSDITGSFFFYAYVNHNVVTQAGTVPVVMDIEGKTFDAGSVEYNGVGEARQTTLTKSGWISSDDVIHYQVPINRAGVGLLSAVVTDSLQSVGVSYLPETLKIEKGTWVAQNGSWVFQNGIDVTSDFTVNYTEDGRGFSIDFGNINPEDGYYLTYDVVPSYKPADGENFFNRAILVANGTELARVNYRETYKEAGGSAEGYVYSINLRKTAADGSALSGAIFRVTRDANGEVLGDYGTDSEGNVTITGLLKGDYTITEIQAPDGYQPLAEPIKISENDFGSDKSVSRDIVNEPAVTTTTTEATTTESPTTTTAASTTTAATTTESPTTTAAPTSTTTTTTTESPTTTTQSTTTTVQSTTESATTTAVPTSTTTTQSTTTTTTTQSTTTTVQSTTESTTTTAAPTSTTTTTTTESPTTTSTTTTTSGETTTPADSQESSTNTTPAPVTSTSADKGGKGKKKLPSTGEQENTVVILAGVAVLSVAGLFLVNRKKEA
ncbi:Ig-like domain-containing protein [Streptococcus sp. H49]|uniref:Ig-like domain-containing protein n=1 Tax=Streptococcus huangxiaojuni TaxID=3237239 RepID=UPI0034A578C2